ncbi:MAG TPA: hypothetical protein VGD27_06040 [Longimicrobiales bacterium]
MRHFFSFALLLVGTAIPVQAQERTIARAGLPHAVAARLQAIAEDPATRIIDDSTTITERVDSDVVVYTGPLVLAGSIAGELVVVDGDVEFKEGSSVTGDVTLIGGEVIGLENASIGGTITMYEEGFGPFSDDAEIMTVNKRTRRVYREDYRRDWGYSSFKLGTGWNYNRVEGLPIHFGPVIETAGRNPTRFEALAIWRTEVSSPWDSEDLGYIARVEQFFGGKRDFRIGASLRSVIDPIESWQMNKVEASLAAFVLHDDYRDYFEREGWSAYLKFTPRATGVTALVEYRDEEHNSQAARDPWTIFDNSDRWRLQPLVADGAFRSINALLEIDRRDDDDFATSGFLVHADVTHGLGGNLMRQSFLTPVAAPAVAFDEQFTTGLIDARVYRQVGHDATLSFRFLGAGALNDKPLPPQFQHALGGAGALPGYASFSADCGARTFSVSTGDEGTAFFPYYGCDRVALFSAEYRGGFDFHWGGPDVWDDDDDWNWDVNASPNWVVFFDAARGWAHDESKARGAADTETLYDVGAGILLGDFGLYGAVPLTGENRDLRFFIRLGPRF